MTQTFEYIEAYFQNELTAEERKNFETKCEQDKDFAEEAAFYITARQALREKLLAQKQQTWKENEPDEKMPFILPAKKSFIQRWLPYAAAACLLLAIAAYFFERPQNPQQYATNYITHNLSQLSQTMDGGKETIQQGIAAYNNKEYDKALQLFESVSQKDSGNSDAKKYIGCVYLMTGNYDKALEQFDQLANMKGLYSNPGIFFKAVTLLQRNKNGDAAQARQLLQQVVQQNLDGSKEAEKWLKKI